MTLGQLQQEFAYFYARLLLEAERQGYQYALAEGARSDEQAEINAIKQAGRERVAELIYKEFPELAKKILNNGANNGVRNSVHQLRLAQDLLLFRNEKYLTASDDYKSLGVWWKKQHPLARWGGDWGDGNHFSFEFGGVK
jgi:hypothetical protein